MTNGVQHVFVADAVLSCALRDLHFDKVALSVPLVKVALSTAVAISVDPRTLADAGARTTARIPQRVIRAQARHVSRVR
jgi:hypothetical protein